MRSKSLRMVAKLVCLAQIASDAGKMSWCVEHARTLTPMEGGYGLKDDYIRQALALRHPWVHVGVDMSPNDIGSKCIIYFEFEGVKGQVSFHSFAKRWEKWTHLDQGLTWDGILGGSRDTCHRLNSRFNLDLWRKWENG